MEIIDIQSICCGQKDEKSLINGSKSQSIQVHSFIKKKSYQHCKTIICKSFNNYIARCVYFYAHPLPPPPSHHHHSFIHSYICIVYFWMCIKSSGKEKKGKNMNQSMEVYGRCGNFNLKHASEIMNEYNKLCMHASNSLIMHQKFSHFLRLLANRIWLLFAHTLLL